MDGVYAPNKEVNTDDFDPVAAQARLQRLTKDETVQIVRFLGDHAVVFSSGGRSQVKDITGETKPEQRVELQDCYIVRYWRGKLWNPKFNRRGQPFDFGPYQAKFYHPDRVAEILRRHKEAA